ncbi:uncharacterized protein PV09_08110 [Verruconis gallopava]|uniref:Zn(2)-C6 fungal-type domain-containing protein n=1 Tax=Verruconis gallopava TaxID=253628 RepID=A0A0D1XDX8_9PEZI|nr:uncharacterized protein PV09_08110 [Verruconis gallopava]KIW00401.1 hypothetical protein PV09_08110 [Verruconis gallopava]
MAPQTGVQVFRVALRTKPNENRDAKQVPTYRARRTHKKSRGGCLACKDKHKKCDEIRPRCSACSKRDSYCRYPDDERQQGSGSSKALIPRPSIDGQRLKFTTPFVLLHTGQHTEHDLLLLDHFVKSTTKDLQGQNATFVYATKALELAKEKSYLMHAAIAQAACHLNQLNPDDPKFRMAEAFHTQLASRGLCEAVNRINGLKDSDAVLTTAMLVNGISFCSAEYRDDEFVPQWWWLRVQLGLRELLARTSPYHSESMWKSLFDASDSFQICEPPTNDLAQRIADFCGISDSSTAENCVYFEPVRWLWPIVTRPPRKKYLLLYLRFIGSITNEFVDLLEARDEKALLIFGHWLALMCSINEWWSVRRTRRECWKICDFLLNKLRGPDLELLEFPAQACGYL